MKNKYPVEKFIRCCNDSVLYRNEYYFISSLLLFLIINSDPLNRRAVRVSMGSVFLIPWAWLDGSPNELHKLGFRTVAMALTEKSISIDSPILATEPKLAIVMGTEGDGLRNETITEADYVVRIPMANGVDPLNVAAASAIAFWQLRVKD